MLRFPFFFWIFFLLRHSTSNKETVARQLNIQYKNAHSGLPVVAESPLLSDRGGNVNVNSLRQFCDFSTLILHRMPLDAASLRYARNFQLVVIEMLNCKSRHHFRCDLAPPNEYRKSTYTKWLAIRWASWRVQRIVSLFQPFVAKRKRERDRKIELIPKVAEKRLKRACKIRKKITNILQI